MGKHREKGHVFSLKGTQAGGPVLRYMENTTLEVKTLGFFTDTALT